MQCPVCGREVNDEAELMACLTNHMREEATRQAKEMQRVYLMMMASQLTMACVTTHSTPQDVVGTFGEVYGLLENLIGKSDVSAEIEEWLKRHRF
ncbi:MAG: hypothetical protein COS88_01380, partial [Chloroflexi bacterium CG07_land_8_20_14_0_80_51_10]